jgi:hypothetical protein
VGVHRGGSLWGSIVGVDIRGRYWVDIGSPYRGSIVGVHIGGPYWGSILGVHIGGPK